MNQYCERRTAPKWRRRVYRIYQHVAVWFTTALFVFGGWVLITTRVPI